jgi:RNA polymerase sigma factor (sigma-70 family)
MTITIEDVTKETDGFTLEEEIQLILLAKDNVDYKDFVFKHFTRLIVSIAKKYIRGDTVSLKDLIQQGYLGLDRAIKEYSPDHQKRFSTYARWWVTAFVVEYYRLNSRSFSISGSISGKLHGLVQANEELEQEMGRAPTTAEIAEKTGYEEGHVVYLQRFLHIGVPIHEFTSNEGEESEGLQNVLADSHCDSPLEREIRVDGVEAVKRAIAQLTDVEQFVLNKRYGLDGGPILTLNEVGGKMVELGKGKKKTAERVRQIQLKAEEKLKKVLNK